MFKSGFITIVGKPNVGKSTLLNAIIGEKVAIVSWRPQTTRNKINGILTTDTFQAVFVDTPGIHESKNKLGEYMMKSVKTALEGVDAVIYVINAESKLDDKDCQFIEGYCNGNVPIIVAINKVDSADKKNLFDIMQTLTQYPKIKEVVPISALKGENVEFLTGKVVELLGEGQPYFDEDAYTDKNLCFMAAEIIREKAMKSLSDEVPYGICVNINKFAEERNCIHIDADLIVEKQAHKPIVIGRGGAMLKKIGTEARIELEKLVGGKVFLQLWVKVKPDWRDSNAMLDEYGYNDKEI